MPHFNHRVSSPLSGIETDHAVRGIAISFGETLPRGKVLHQARKLLNGLFGRVAQLAVLMSRTGAGVNGRWNL